MRIEELLRAQRTAILDEAEPAVARMEHYRRDGERATRRRLDALFGEVTGAVERLDLAGLVAHAAAVARERVEAGFELAEVLGAFDALERAIRHRAVERLSPAERAWALALVGTAFAHGRESLGRTFAAASAPALDLTALFTGAARASGDAVAAEHVYPV